MRLFLLGTDFIYDTVKCDLGALGDFVTLDEKTSFSSLDVSYSWEKVLGINGNAHVPLEIFGTLHEVLVFLGLACFEAYYCVHHSWLYGKFDNCLVNHVPVISSWVHKGCWISG